MSTRFPEHDPTMFLDEFRTAQISHLLVAAVTRFDVGRVLTPGPLSFEMLREKLKLAERPAIVLFTALRSIGLIEVDATGRIGLTDYGRETMSPDSPFSLRGYVSLGAASADVQHLIACLAADKPVGDVSFVYHGGDEPSALDDPATSNLLTRAMADRARNIAPAFAAALDLSGVKHLVDVGGGHGIYSYELMRKHRTLYATILDRQPALDVAFEYAEQRGLGDRTRFLKADAHRAVLEDPADAVLIANLLHDYSERDAEELVRHYANSLPQGGRLIVLDAFLNSVPEGSPPVPDGPRAVAAYGALLFTICEGRCYRFDEVQGWMRGAGLQVDENIVSLPVHSSVLVGWKG